MTFLVGAGIAAPAAATWVGLTLWTGKTYHLAPLVIGLAPGLGARWAAQRPLGRLAALAALVLGAAAVAVAWLVLVALAEEPDTPFVAELRGGVLFEVVVGGLVGAAAGALVLLRPAGQGRSSSL